jgi:hypothetical protein
VLIAEDSEAESTTFGEELTAKVEKLGGVEEAKEGEVGPEALSKTMLEDSTESRAPGLAAGESETVGSKRSSAWMVPSTNEDSAILKKDGVGGGTRVARGACVNVWSLQYEGGRCFHEF